MMRVKRFTVTSLTTSGASLPDGKHEAVLASDYDALAARLAEAERLLKFVNDLMSESSGVYGFHLNGDLERWQYWPETDEIDRFIRPADSAPAVQPCGHPWKAQHDFKCILCSSAGPAL